MPTTHEKPAKHKPTRTGRAPAAKALPRKQKPTAAARLAAARKDRYLASAQERGRAAAHLTPEELAEYRRNNPLPEGFWSSGSNGRR